MGNTNGRIAVPVKVTDIKTVLGVSNNNVGYLCSNKHGKINPDSKEKPMEINTTTKPTVAQKKSVFWGFNIPTSYLANNSLNIPNTNALGEWTYVPPTTAKRLGDFDGYDHAVRVVAGDWGINSIYLGGASAPTGFISKILNSEVKQNITNGIGVTMRSSNPSKPTQVCPKDMGQLGNLGYFVYKAAPDAAPSWRFVQVRIDTKSVTTTTGHSGTIRFSDLGITSENIDDGIEMYVRIIGACFDGYDTNLASTQKKSSLNYKGVKQCYDVYITSGAYMQMNNVNFQRSTWEGKPAIALHGNGYILPSWPGSPVAAPTNGIVGANIRVYSQAGTLLQTLSRNITYSSQPTPVINTINNIRKEFFIGDLNWQWYRLEGEFCDRSNGANKSVKSATISVLKSSLGL